MTTISTHRSEPKSATIYQFPLGGRAGLAKFGQRPSHDAKPTTPAETVLTDAWYHQEAIREAQQATKQ